MAGVIGALLTILGTAPIPFFYNLPPHSATSDFLFDAFMYLATPTIVICKVLGISQGHSWLLYMAIVVNTLLSVVIGTFIGWLIQSSKVKS